MNRWLETDTQKTARNIINVLNESAAGMVKKEINKDKPEEAPKNKKVALEKRVTRAAIKGKKPESKNAKMPKKIAKKVVKEELEPEVGNSIEDQISDLQDYLDNTPEVSDEERAEIQAEIDSLISQLGEKEVDNKIMNESTPGTDAYDKLVQGDDVYFRNEEGVALLGHYADNYPEPEEYDDGFKPEYGGTEEGLQKAKEAAANRDVWEFMEVFEDTLQPMNEIYAYVYGQDELMEMLKTLRQVDVVKKLEENQIEDARKDSIEKGLLSEEESEFKVGDVVKVPYKYGSYTPGEFTEAPIIDISEGRYVTVEIPSKLEVTMDQLKKWNTLGECDESLKEDSYDSGIFYEIEQAFEEAGLNPIRFIDDGILTRNIGWTVSSNGVSQQISCDGSWYDEDEDEDDEEYNESLKEAYSEKFGGDPKDFIGDLISVKYQLSNLNLDSFGSHLARQMVEDFIDTCDRQIEKAKRLASGDEFYTEADNRTYKDADEAEYYRNKELYANSNLARHREAMEKAKKACEEKGIKLDEDNYLSRTRKEEPLDLVAYKPEITSIDEVKDKYVKIRGDFHKVVDVKPEGDKFVISFAAGTGTAIGGEFEPATLDEIKRLQLYTENK